MIQDSTNYINYNTFVGSNADVNTIDKFNYNSFYRAYVIANNDPEKLGRVKVEIPTLHNNSTTYPWAYPATLTGFGFQTGMFILPPIGSLVWVTFEYSDEHRPIYFGGIPTRYAEGKTQRYGNLINNGVSTPVTGDDIPIEYTGTQQIIYKSPKNSLLMFDSSDTKNLIILKNAFGQGLEIAALYDMYEGTYNRYTRLIYDDRNYFELKENEVHLIIDGEEVDIGGGGSGSASWGHITGQLENQTDLKNALDLKANDADISTVGKTNNYNDLDNKPTIPTKTSQLTNDSNYITNGDIPTNISAFNNDVGYLTTETDPTVPSWAKQSNKPTYTKSEVGLGNVDNKSSETIRSEITSSNVTTALGFTPLNSAEKGASSGVATLDSNGKIPASELPSYVDDVLEFATRNDFPATGESGKIYIAKDTNVTYRWSGSAYVVIGSDLALGETHSTAYYGDLGKIAYDHSQSAHAPSNAQANLIESISVNNSSQTITNKNVNITVPTKTSDLTNDSGYVSDLSNYVTLNGAQTITGTKTFSNANSLVYSGIEAASLSADRPVWFAKNDNNGIPVYNNNFKYNPSTKTLTVENVSGNASTATSATKATNDKNGNDITTTYYKASNPNGYTSNIGTITEITMNGASKGTSGNVDLGTVITEHQSIKTINNNTITGTGNVSVGTITGVSVNGTSVATSGTANITSMPASILSGAIPSAVTATTQAQGNNSTKIATTAYVDKAVADLPEPMVFKGSLGTDGTITDLPTASSSNEGYTYKVITTGTYAGQAAKVGDTFISDGSAWVLIPSGDEPSGTVTSITIKATSPIVSSSSSAITSSGTRTISHANSGVTAGTYKSVTVNETGHVTAGTNPTTLGGYGITDAKIASGVITLGSNTITPLTASSTLDATKLSGTIPTSCYTNTKNTAGSTDTSSKIFLIGATSQAANPQTYSDNEVYVTSGVLTTKSVQVGGTAATMQYNSTDKCIEFIFN